VGRADGDAYIEHHHPMLSLVLRLLPRALVSPSLARALVVVAWRFRRNAWYARFPFLPLPARDYVRWRMYTAYGDADAVPPVDDVVRYARWAARFP
jgi:hypothetical protein